MDTRSFFLGRCCFLLLSACLATGLLQGTAAQTDSGGPVSVAGSDRLTVGGLLQTDLYLGRAAQNDGFRARSTRLRLGGEANDIQYVVQTDFTSPSVLLDAFARLPLSEQFDVTAGLFKTPFSAEFLTSRPDILFAERARVVNNIAPNRQPGVTVSGPLSERLSATVGAFNGTRGLQPNDNDLFLYVGRLTGSTPITVGQLEAGANVAYSIDDAVALSNMGPPSVTSSFTGTRLLFGADARLDTEQWFVAGELNTAQLDPEETTDTFSPFGFYFAGGVSVSDGHQVRARYDQYDPDIPALPAPSGQLTLGYNYEPSSLLRVLANYQAPVDNLNKGFVTVRLQVALR